MRSSKLKLTHLVSKINEVLPEGDDIFGYPGINKTMITKSLLDSHSLLASFVDYNSMFEVTFMKRNIASIVDECYDFLKDNNLNSENFDVFLKEINKIRAEIKTTYILVSQKPLRLDSDIAEAKELLREFQSDLEVIKDLKFEIDTAKEEGLTIIEALTHANQVAEGNNTKISDLINGFEVASEKIERVSKDVDEWKENIESFEENLSSNSKESESLLSRINEIKDRIEIQQSEINSQSEKQKGIIENNEKHQREIKDTLEGASKKGLAGSFFTRKKELSRALFFWGLGVFLSIGALAVASFILVGPIIKNPDSFNTVAYFTRFPILGALVWLGWFCAKQYGFTTRIREEYAFKYAISMAFEGYKKEAIDVNAELLEELLKLTLDSISVSPAQCFDTKNNHATPINEISEGVLKEIRPFLSEIAKSGMARPGA